jgi:sec-independent protein translocase protein TatC
MDAFYDRRFMRIFLILPFAVNFGVIFKISDIIVPLYDLSDYTTLFLQVVLGMGVIFLFPILIYFLTSIGILTPTFMKTYRRHAIVLIMVVAAIITPADV